MPKVSIIIPTYNRVKYLRECLKSVFDQTFQDFEIIVIDDGSYENIEELVIKDFPDRITYLRHKENLGKGTLFPAVFTGLNAARGEYIVLLGDDDLLEKEHLETAMQIFKNSPEIGCFSSDLKQIDFEGNIRSKESHFTGYLKRRNPEFKVEDKIVTAEDVFMYALGTASSGVVFTREMIEEIGFYRQEYKMAADWEYVFRIAASRFKLYFCSKPLVKYRSHSMNISKDYYEVDKLKIEILSQAIQKYPQLKKNLGYRNIAKRMSELMKELIVSSINVGRYKGCIVIIVKSIVKIIL